MNYNEIINFDTGNCHGISVTLFVSGCHLHCPECHNKQTWDFDSGKLFTNDTIEEILDKLKSPHISYFVLSGGNPVEKHYDKFCQKYHGKKFVLTDAIKDRYGKYHDDVIYEIIFEQED